MKSILLASTLLAVPAMAASTSTSQTQQSTAPQSLSQIPLNPPSPTPVSSTCTSSGGLNYSIGGLPGTGNSLLLRQSSGAYDLLIWNEGSSATVNVNLGASGTINVYDPTQSAKPIQTATGSSVSVNLTDHMIIVELMNPKGAGGGKPAQSTASFVNSIGINQHVGFGGTIYANAPLEIQEMAYLGLNLVRDGAPATWEMGPWQQVAAAGIKSNFVTGPAGQDITSNLPDSITAMAQLIQQYPGSIVSIEGPNELNDQLVYYNGAASTSGPSVAVAIQQYVASQVRATAALAAVPLVNVSINNCCSGWQNYVAGMGNLDPVVNEANWHVYFQNAEPAANVKSMYANALQSAPGKPVVYTETGYPTAPNGGVDPGTQARLLLNAVADAYVAGVQQTFIYELMNGSLNPAADDTEDSFGLFLADGTPKPSGTAFHNLTSILGPATSANCTASPVTASASTTSPTSDVTVASQAPAARYKYLPDETTNPNLPTQLASITAANSTVPTSTTPPATSAPSQSAAMAMVNQAVAQSGGSVTASSTSSAPTTAVTYQAVEAQITEIEAEIITLQSELATLQSQSGQ